jgi:hypothetical protein
MASAAQTWGDAASKRKQGGVEEEWPKWSGARGELEVAALKWSGRRGVWGGLK